MPSNGKMTLLSACVLISEVQFSNIDRLIFSPAVGVPFERRRAAMKRRTRTDQNPKKLNRKRKRKKMWKTKTKKWRVRLRSEGQQTAPRTRQKKWAEKRPPEKRNRLQGEINIFF